MAESKTKPTDVPVEEFLQRVSERRCDEARVIIDMLREITGEEPMMWGPSIIGFGQYHYRSDSGSEGDMPAAGFSPRKSSLTIYVPEGFDRHGDLLDKLGKHKTLVSCLYLTKLADVDLTLLRELLRRTYQHHTQAQPAANKPQTLDQYVASIPPAALPRFDELRAVVRDELPGAHEDLSYGMVSFRTVPKRRAKAYVAGWRDHVALYPVPKDPELQQELAPYRRGKGTLWFPLDQPLPEDLIRRAVLDLAGR